MTLERGVVALVLALAVTASGCHVAQAGTPRQEAIKWKKEAERLRRQIASDEQRRVRLDITRLERETGVEGRFRPFVPLVGVLVGVATGLVGFRRWQTEQRRAREIRTEEGIAHNLERLVDRPQDGTSRSSSALGAIRSLDALTPRPSGWWNRNERDAACAQRKRVTETLEAIVVEDLVVIGDPSEARLPVLFLEWKPFADQVASEERIGNAVLNYYARALGRLHADQKAYFSSVRRDHGEYRSEQVNAPDDEKMRLFAQIVAGYERYVDMAPQRLHEHARDQFRNALNNDALTDDLFPSAPQ